MSDIKDIIDILNTYKENGLTGTDRSPISINETDLIIAELAALRYENEMLRSDNRELVEAANKVIAISDRKHDAWDRLKAAVEKHRPT